MRGYRHGSFDSLGMRSAAGCTGQLPGLRSAARHPGAGGHLELRFPLFGVLGIGSGYYGVLPLDLHVFGDGGVAWDSDEDPSFAGGDREPDQRCLLAARQPGMGTSDN